MNLQSNNKFSSPFSGGSNESLHALFDLSDVLFVTLDMENRVRFVNQKICDITGYTKEELIGAHWFEKLVPKRFVCEIESVFKSIVKEEIKVPYAFESSILTKTGEERIIRWRNTVLKNENSERRIPLPLFLCLGDPLHITPWKLPSMKRSNLILILPWR